MKTASCVAKKYHYLTLIFLGLGLGSLGSVSWAGSEEPVTASQIAALKIKTFFQTLSRGKTPSKTSWPTFRKGPKNQALSNISTRELLHLYKSGERAPSQFDTKGLVWGTPVSDEEDNLYVGSASREFYSLAPDGKVRWTYKLHAVADSLIDSAAALVPGTSMVVVPGGDGFLHALDRNTGKLIWEFQAKGVSEETHQSGTTVNSFEGHVQVGPGTNGLIYAGSDNGHMYAVNRNGKQVWSLKTGMMIWSTPVFGPGDTWMAFGSLDGNLYLVNPRTGDLLGTYPSKADIKSSPTIDEKGNIYFGNSNGEMISLQVFPESNNKFGFKKNWSYQTDREVYSSPTLMNGKLVFGSVDGSMYAVNANTGALLWKYTIYSHILSSPLITQDQVVLFGAKNGKIYALNLETGERIWSYRSTLDPVKSNLDSSVMIDSHGILHVGSYNGNIYHVPYEYCLTHRSDRERCEFGGTKDLPDYIPTERGNTATLRWIPGQEHRTFDHSNVLQMRLVVMTEGEYIENAAIDARTTKLRIEVTDLTANTKAIEVKADVSSDGKFLNITPKGFFNPGHTYQVKVKGLYYLQTKNYIYDRLTNLIPFNEWVNEKPFEATETFRIKPSSGKLFAGTHSNSSMTWGLKSLYLFQPEALDTYLPAALDGQGFIVTAFGFNHRQNKMMMLGLPAVPGKGGDDGFILQPEPSKVFTLDGSFQNDSLQGHGAFSLAGMGGDIPFSSFAFMATAQPETQNLLGSINAKSYCPSIKGNGTSYSFPFSLINQVCDPWLYSHAVGTFQGLKFPETPQTIRVGRFDREMDQEVSVDLHIPEVSGSHLVTLVQYNPVTVQVTHQQTQLLSFGNSPKDQNWTGKFQLKAKWSGYCQRESSSRVALFYDGKQLNLDEMETCSSPTFKK